MKLWLDVADASQQLAQHCLPIPAVAGLDTTHPFCRVSIHFHCTVAMGTKGLGGGNMNVKSMNGFKNSSLQKVLL